MKVICTTTCTVPGKSIVKKGDVITVDKFDLKAHPWLKHFEQPATAPEDPKAKKAGKKAEPDPLD